VGFELFIALRYLLARRKQAFISVISLISTIGVAVGVMALVIALALMTGLQGELRDRILGSTPHIYAWKIGGVDDYRAAVARLKQFDGVVGAAPALLDKALVRTPQGDAFISLKGVDPALEPDVTDIRRAMLKGNIMAIADESEDQPPGILLGKDLAAMLGSPGHPIDVGESVTLVTPQGTLTPMGMTPGRSVRARVVGIYSLGLYEFDSSYGFISLDFAKRLTGRNTPDLLQVKVRDVYAAPQIADAMSERLGKDWSIQDWADMNKSLFSALWLEKMAISMTIGLIVMVAALNIIASLILLVMEKSRDIAILKTMGTSSQRVMTIFMLQGLIIGLVGTTVGGIGGLVLCSVLTKYKLIHIPADVYQVSYVPFIVLPFDFAVVILGAVAICFIATLYPSRQASKLDPVQALRFE
jgi:lipoprotein-releasing system permease protein